MAERVLMNGNTALGEAAIRAGCDCYFGYPITPQNELTSYMATHMPPHGRAFLQAESEIAAINMVYGASAAGKRAMTSSSSPGVSLKQEGISTLAGAELPAVIVNVQRAGPGLGNIAPAQADYFQAVKGGGHGDYRQIVLAPDSVQEMHDLTFTAFDLADRYRGPVMLLTDGRLGQMMEPFELRTPVQPTVEKPWATTGAAGRPPNMIRSLYLVVEELEQINLKLQAKYRQIESEEVMLEERMTDDCDVLLVAYGSSARVCKGALSDARAAGLKVGLLRPITLWPFPTARIRELAARIKSLLVVEMSAGQLIEDVQLAVAGQAEVLLENRLGGFVPSQQDVLKRIEAL
ncbi:MAG: 3-methyl-2-oxobutanoate dehydrogenase subunit VorB [Verrucomicrobia bacterium]|jgi:2-oxoglutarate/2-oxoacid ferredoxin oxidoreductase subunit alpha|nr:3-methyl-2-oxobutanoate dehydrogenase subunit VorB [Verrucomicrobiota bacterium]MBT7065874.1 3-methyl-2-oxobutanoate dehydrogenase subunit VorB [Verrucomicrobiota bacterium]MBT7701108.1 3-methyl-2-oxobutanoate dehydrogenase subunit VorB [Verrucomicrobiota bacterium]